MSRFATVLTVSVWCALGMLPLPSDASAQRVSVEFAGGYDQLGNHPGYGEFTWPLLPYGNWSTARSGGLGVDGRLAFSVGERWELGAAFSLKRATMDVVRSPGCFEFDECNPPETIASDDYTEVVSSLATARFWPNGTPDRGRTVRPLVGLHTGMLWFNDGLDVVNALDTVNARGGGTRWDRAGIHRGVPMGFDAGIGVAISDRAYLLTYLTGQMLLVATPDRELEERDPYCARRPHSGVGDPCTRTLVGDPFGFRWGLRAGIGIRL